MVGTFLHFPVARTNADGVGTHVRSDTRLQNWNHNDCKTADMNNGHWNYVLAVITPFVSEIV